VTNSALPVSVVIPAYNAAPFLSGAIASVNAQTSPASELLVVDDGSSDETAHVARAAGATVIRQSNGGAGAARNAGVRAASHPWIAFLDADDRWHPDKLASQWAAHQLRPDVAVIASDYLLLGMARAEPFAVLPLHRAYGATPRTGLGGEAVFLERHAVARTLPSGQFLCPSTLLVSRALILEDAPFRAAAELPSDELCHVAEDFEWALRALRFSDIIVLERPLVDYTLRPGSLSSSAGRQRYGDVKLGEFVARNPAAYPSESLAVFRAERPRKQREAALEFLRSREPRKAQAILREALRERGRLDDAALFGLASALGTPAGDAAFGALRSLWRSRP